jgi:hypothetical protein
MNVGEVGNFISYAFAPASVVAPLGTVSAFAPACYQYRSNNFAVCSHCKLFLCAFDAGREVQEGRIFFRIHWDFVSLFLA